MSSDYPELHFNCLLDTILGFAPDIIDALTASAMSPKIPMQSRETELAIKNRF